MENFISGFVDSQTGKLLDSPPVGITYNSRIEYWHMAGLYGYNFSILKEYSRKHPDVLIEFIDIDEVHQRSTDEKITGFPTTRVFVNGVKVADTQCVMVTEKWLDSVFGCDCPQI